MVRGWHRRWRLPDLRDCSGALTRVRKGGSFLAGFNCSVGGVVLDDAGGFGLVSGSFRLVWGDFLGPLVFRGIRRRGWRRAGFLRVLEVLEESVVQLD